MGGELARRARAKSLFASAQVSRRKFGFENTGGTSTNILDSPFLSRGFTSGVPATQHYNSPYFDSNDPENRNNRQITGSLAYFWTTNRAGSHDIKVGYENFQTTRTGGNSQTSTGYVFQTDYQVSGGAPVLDGNQKPIPDFMPGVFAHPELDRDARRGAGHHHPVRLRARPLGVQLAALLRHRCARRVRAQRGHRRHRRRGHQHVGAQAGREWDPAGDGRTTVQASYARYAGKYSEAQIGRNTPVGSPNLLTSSTADRPGRA